MWNPNPMSTVDSQDEDDSWEVKAFAEDTGNAMGTTWPPRSYTCTFCRREFRSAQALGGHMNVHRRDRAQLHQAQNLKNPNLSSSTSSSSTLLIPTDQELVADGDLCLLFSLPSPNGMFKPSSSRLLSVMPHPSTGNNLMNFPAVIAPPNGFNYSLNSNSGYNGALTSIDHKHSQRISLDNKKKITDLAVDGIDLELRLGCSSSGS